MNTSKWTAAPARSMKCFAMMALGVTLLAGSVFGAELPAEPQAQSTANTIFCWGYDEITWFSVLPEADRNAWLHYAWNWIAQNDPNGHLEMPGSRVITPGRNSNGPRWYWANTRSDACPMGSNTEQTIKEIFAENFAEK